MIKKSYMQQLLHLILTLSLIRVDPNYYLGYGWESQLALQNGNGWDLEIRATPITEYPYANRKAILPLIDDLVRFNHHTYNYNDFQAYLLTAQNETINIAETNNNNIINTNSNSNSNNNNNNSNNNNIYINNDNNSNTNNTNSQQSSILTRVVVGDTSRNNDLRLNARRNTTEQIVPAQLLNFNEDDLFLNFNNLQNFNSTSILAQTISDLNDYNENPNNINNENDIFLQFPYAGLPLKDDIELGRPNEFFKIFTEEDLTATASSAAAEDNALSSVTDTDIKSIDSSPNSPNLTTIIDWSTYYNQSESSSDGSNVVKGDEVIINDDNDDGVGTDLKFDRPNTTNTSGDNESDDEKCVSSSAASVSSGICSNVEESEIIEELWKQDVDLGFSFNPVEEVSDVKKDENSDEKEKLQALQEIKEVEAIKEDIKEDLDEWAGIQFRIDDETGEYIQLEFDDILKDVLQLTELTTPITTESIEKALTSSNTTESIIDIKAEKLQSELIDDGVVIEEDEEEEETIEKIDATIDDIVAKIEKLETSAASVTTSRTSISDLDLSSDLSQISLDDANCNNTDNNSNNNSNNDNSDELKEIDMMIQSAGPFQHPRSGQNYNHGSTVGATGSNSFRQTSYHHHHHHHHQSRVPLSRAVSMEQRLQDIANLFNPMGVGMGVGDMSSYTPHYPSHYTYQGSTGPIPQHSQFSHPHSHAVLHNASLAELGGPPPQPHYGGNLGTAVSSSMHLTNPSHDSDSGASGGYKMEHDMMYYSNASTDLNHTSDGFINAILNDDDLQLMDMGVNESFYTMRMIEPNSTSNNSSVLGITSGVSQTNGLLPPSLQNAIGVSLGNGGAGVGIGNGTVGLGVTLSSTGDRLDASSDSAVSSMGSERVPSLSDSEWGDAGSDSAQDYHQRLICRNSSKYGGTPYDFSYSNRITDRQAPSVAQKKHHMFAKRYFQEQNSLPSLVQHQHQQQQPQQPTQANQHLLHQQQQQQHQLQSHQQQQQPQLQQSNDIKYEYEPYVMHQNSTLNLIEDPILANTTSIINKQHQQLQHQQQQQQQQQQPQPQQQQQQSTHLPEMKYSCSIDFARQNSRDGSTSGGGGGTMHDIVGHNHTYTLPQGNGAMPRPQTRDKKIKRMDEEHLSRDEKRARTLNIPMPVHDIINLPMDEFNERLSKYDLNENQLSLIRDIRRRGKNKVAAQNCRKRKLDQILCLEDEVKEVRRRKDRLCHEREMALQERKRVQNKFSALHRHIFQNLRDPNGMPYSPSQYSLQQSADGNVFLLPRDSKDTSNSQALTNHHHQNGSSSSQGGHSSHHRKE